MKMILILIAILTFTLTGCKDSKIISSTKVEELPTLTGIIDNDKEMTFNYQGYIEIKTHIAKKDADNLNKIVFRNIKFSSNPEGLPALYKFNNSFDYDTVKVLYSLAKKGDNYTTFDYDNKQFTNFGFSLIGKDEYMTKLHFVIMKVDRKASLNEIKRKVTFEMQYEFKNGNKISKNIEVTVP